MLGTSYRVKKIAPDLLESIRRLTRIVKEEFRRTLMKMNQFAFKIQQFRVSTFWVSGKMKGFRRRLQV